MAPYNEMLLESDKLSALMADMVSLNNRTSPPLGPGPFAPIKSLDPLLTSSPNLRLSGNGVKRKHRTFTEYVITSKRAQNVLYVVL